MNAVFGEKRGIYFFFDVIIASFADLTTRNFRAFVAGILVVSPAAGLRPTRVLRVTRTKRPRPGIANTPVFCERSAISERTAASRFETPSRLAVSETEGNDVAIFAARAMIPLLWHALAVGRLELVCQEFSALPRGTAIELFMLRFQGSERQRPSNRQRLGMRRHWAVSTSPVPSRTSGCLARRPSPPKYDLTK